MVYGNRYNDGCVRPATFFQKFAIYWRGTMMKSREIVNGLLRKGPVVRVGLMESFWEDTLLQWTHEGYPTRQVYKRAGEKRWRPEDGQWEDIQVEGEYQEPLPPWMHFGYDMAGVGPWFDNLPIRDYDEVESETEEWEVRRNGAGAALKFWKHKNGTPEHIDFRMTTRQIWEQDYRPYLLELDPERVKVAEIRTNREEADAAGAWTHYGHTFVWELMRRSFGDVVMYESLVLDPGWIHDYNQVYLEFYKRHFDYMIEQAGRPDGVWLYEDLGYKNGLFASPKVLRSLVFPYFAELVAYFHSKGLPVVLHSCGSQAEAVPLVVEAGFDALNPMERKAKGNDPFTFAERYGDKLAFIGGLDVRILETNDRELVRREVGAYIDGMKGRGARLVFGSDHSITPLVKYDTYRYALDVYREHMNY